MASRRSQTSGGDGTTGLRESEAMNVIISKVLRYGVLLSSAVIVLGTGLLLASEGLSSATPYLAYDPGRVPHGAFPVTPSALLQGVLAFSPFAVIELGILILLATPVSRVLFSVFLFAAERDRTYVYITLGVLCLLLFSILVTPFIPAFGG